MKKLRGFYHVRTKVAKISRVVARTKDTYANRPTGINYFDPVVWHVIAFNLHILVCLIKINYKQGG
jgi:hypothetical protein